jgi:hypothetical protein
VFEINRYENYNFTQPIVLETKYFAPTYFVILLNRKKLFWVKIQGVRMIYVLEMHKYIRSTVVCSWKKYTSSITNVALISLLEAASNSFLMQ